MNKNPKEILEIVKENTWNIQGFNGYQLYLHCAASNSGWMVTETFGTGYSHFFYIFSKGRAYMYYDEKDWESISDAYYSTVRDETALTALIARYHREYEALLSQDVDEKFDNEDASLDVLADHARALGSRLGCAVGFAHAIEGITFGSEKKLREVLALRGKADETTLSRLSSPTHPSFLLFARQALWGIKNAEKEKQKPLIEDFLSRFGWIENTYLGSGKLTAEKVLARASELSHEPSTEEGEAIARDKEGIMRELSFSREERFVVATIDLCFQWQDDRKKYILGTIEIFDRVIGAIARNLGCDTEALKFTLPEELTVENLTSAVFQEALQKRRMGSAVYSTPEKTLIFTGDDFRYFVENLHVSFDEGIKEIKGVAASKGIAQGRVRVCDSVSDIDKFSPGDVLVASMTRPEYLPAMQKAIAFITNEGGITCHAAIIARELRKPCIIGTRVATQVLKDGDLVEVDADRGIVKILDRK